MSGRLIVCAAALAGLAGLAQAQWTIDGRITAGDNYGGILWVQDTPTGFGDNTAGIGGTPGNPADVIYGCELAIPLSVLGSPNPANGIKLGGFISGGNTVSNQVLGADPLPPNSANLGNGRNLDFSSAAFPGNQYLTIFPAIVSSAPTMDGELDGGLGGYWAGRRVWVQSNYTGFGDNGLGQPGNANGSELDNLYAVVHDNGTPGDASDDVLYLFVGGNFHNGNRVNIFFDAIPGGQQRMLFGNASWGFGFTTELSASTAENTDGLKFDDGFEPEVWSWFNVGGSTLYMDWVTIPTTPPGVGSFIGCTAPQANAGQVGLNGCGGSGNPAGVNARFDNRNTAGVGGTSGGQTTPHRDLAFGSEIDGLYGRVDGDYLYLLVTGNLENNWNKLVLFFDADPLDGQNVLRADNVDLSYNGLNRMGFGGNGTPGAGPGLTFDADFFADYVMFVTNGNNPVDMYTDCAVLRANGPRLISGFIADYSSFHGGPKATTDPNNFPATYAHYQDFSRVQLQSDAPPRMVGDWAMMQPPPNPGPDYNNLPPEFAGQILMSIDNNNVAGVTDVSVAGADQVITGVELRVPLSEIGCVGCGTIKVAGGLLSDGFGVASNQWLGGVGGAANLGEPTLIDFTAMTGTQYVSISTTVTPPCDPDVNCDGSINGFDIEATEQAVNGDFSNFCQASADLNGDGAENGFDIETEEQRVNGEPC